jgi:hypothetical protein
MVRETERAQMIRSIVAFPLAAAVLVGVFAPQPARAQDGRDRLDARPLVFYADIGYVNLFSYPKWLSIGPELELRFGRHISINPELAIWARDSFRGGVDIVPGATANLRFRRFFIGGGAVRRVPAWAESASGWLVPKIQAGYFAGPSRLTVTLMYLNLEKEIAVGMTIGISIGRRPREPED